jgi:hypothetical protein
MTVDLNNIKVGDTVHLRCGGSIVVGADLEFRRESFYIDGLESFYIDGLEWYANGKFYSNETTPFDIISITPKPEPRRIKGWVNIYNDVYESKECAKRNAPRGVRACIEIDVAEGEGLPCTTF